MGGLRQRHGAGLGAVVVGVCLALPAGAGAGVAVAVPDVAGDSIVSLDTANPTAFTSELPITGLAAGERIVGIDFRHAPDPAQNATPRLFALAVDGNGAGANARLYTIDPGTGVATAVGAGTPVVIQPTSIGAYGVDFSPAADRFRVVNAADENMRFNPNNGLRADFPGNDTDLNPAGQQVTAVAYDRVSTTFVPPPPAQPTTLYAMNPVNDMLARIGGLDGATPNPNTGMVFDVGPLTVNPAPSTGQNFDIAVDGTALATLTVGGVNGLYAINLTSGGATLVGNLPNPVRAFALLPDSGVQLTVDSITQTEGGTATFTVTRTGSLASTQSVGYQTVAGTAAGSDFTQVDGRVNFVPDESAKTFEVATTADSVDEPDETVEVRLTSPDALLSLGSPSSAVLTITDGDRTRPFVKVKGLKKELALDAFLKGLKMRLIPDEAASFRLTLLPVGGKGGKLGLAAARLARKSLKLAEGRRNVTLKPNAKRVGKPKKSFRVNLKIVATDAAGNKRRLQRTISVEP